MGSLALGAVCPGSASFCLPRHTRLPPCSHPQTLCFNPWILRQAKHLNVMAFKTAENTDPCIFPWWILLQVRPQFKCQQAFPGPSALKQQPPPHPSLSSIASYFSLAQPSSLSSYVSFSASCLCMYKQLSLVETRGLLWLIYHGISRTVFGIQ